MLNTSLQCFQKLERFPKKCGASFGFELELLHSSSGQAVAFCPSALSRISTEKEDSILFDVVRESPQALEKQF
jgi:hypothetical protein